MYTVAVVQCSLPRGRQSRAELMHCLACAMLSEAQGSGESREACITPSEVDKVHQWPIYSSVQYQASSPLANSQRQHERLSCFCKRVSCQSKQNCHAHSRTFAHCRKWERHTQTPQFSSFTVQSLNGQKKQTGESSCVFSWRGNSESLTHYDIILY